MKEILSNYKIKFEAMLEEFCASIATNKVLADSVIYSLKSGGKRIRPILCIFGAELFDKSAADVRELSLAVEMIHCYSLVHDDLPCMDNDILRRGMPTTHIKFGYGNAVLAGDALLNLAFEVMFSAKKYDKAYYMAMREVAHCAGINGMIEGQSIDINEEDKSDFKLADFENIYLKKTSCLLMAGLMSGAIASGADATQQDALRIYACNLGLIFQIVDDLLDIYSTSEILGKSVGKDVRDRKKTLVAVVGEQKARNMIKLLEAQAIAALSIFGAKADTLIDFCKFLSQRNS